MCVSFSLSLFSLCLFLFLSAASFDSLRRTPTNQCHLLRVIKGHKWQNVHKNWPIPYSITVEAVLAASASTPSPTVVASIGIFSLSLFLFSFIFSFYLYLSLSLTQSLLSGWQIILDTRSENKARRKLLRDALVVSSTRPLLKT